VSTREPLSSIDHPVPELPVADVERAQQYYRDTLGFEIGWLYPGKEIVRRLGLCHGEMLRSFSEGESRHSNLRFTGCSLKMLTPRTMG
jgi:catechol 2,3-dioxygenase-like lactoylglutathione lyase family enzyme